MVLVNPVAGGGRGLINGQKIRNALTDRHVIVRGGVTLHKTLGEPEARADQIRRLLKTENPQTLIIVGGDGTDAEVIDALRGTREPLNIMYGRGGSSNNLSSIYGVPRPNQVPDFLAHAQPIDLTLPIVHLNGETLGVASPHSATFGVSGDLFVRGAALKPKLGPVAFMLHLPGAVWDAKLFYVSMDGQQPLPTAEVMIAATSNMGGIAAIPLSTREAKFLAIPQSATLKKPFNLLPGVFSLGEAFLRRLAVSVGISSAVDPKKSLATLSPARQKSLKVGDPPVSIRFSADAEAQVPIDIPTVLNGDPTTTRTHSVTVQVVDSPFRILAAPHSEAMWRHTGKMPPTFPTFGGWWRGVKSWRWPTPAGNVASFVGTVGLESSPWAGWFNNSSLIAGAWLAKINPTASSFLWEMPLGLSSYPIGAIGGAVLSQAFGVERNSIADRALENGGGMTATAIFYKWLGPERVAGIAERTKVLATRMGKQLYAAETAVVNACRSTAIYLGEAAQTIAVAGATLVTPIVIIYPPSRGPTLAGGIGIYRENDSSPELN